MTDDSVAERAEGGDRRRLLLFLLVAALVGVGAGVGGLELATDPGTDPPTVNVTPAPAEPPPGETPTATAVPTRAETPSGTTDTPTPSGTTGTPTPSETAPGSGTATPDWTATPDLTTTRTPTPDPAPAEPPGGDDDGDGRGDPPATGTATPVTATTVATDDDAGDTDGGASLVVEGSTTFVRLSDVAPGDEGRERVRLRNAGDAGGRLEVANVTVRDRENGVVEPERAVDDSPGEGELSGQLLIALLADDGETAVIATGSDPDPLAALAASDEPFRGPALGPDEGTILVLRWRLPAETGNAVQSDGVTVSLEFSLRSVD